MKRWVISGGKKRVFNSINIILIAFLFIELLFVANWVVTGNPVRSTTLDRQTSIGSIQNLGERNYEIQLDYPSYLDEQLRHPKKLFSGRKIRIVKKEGNEISSRQFPSTISLITRDLITKGVISQKRIEVTKYRKNYFGVEIPGETDTGDYFIEFSADNKEYALPIKINGLSEAEKIQINRRSSTTQGEVFHWIYRTLCNNFWESVSGINPHDENYGYLGAGQMLAQTKDGWKTSICYTLDSQTNNPIWGSFGDLKIAFMDDGTPIISTLMFKSSEPITGGIIKDSFPYNYPVSFTQINLAPIPPDLGPDDWIIFDYEKVSVDTYSNSPYYGNIYVFANAVNLGPEYNPRFGQGIFIVKPDGSIFKKIRATVGAAVTSTFVGPSGKIYIAQPDYHGPKIGVSSDGGKEYTYHTIVDFNRDGYCSDARLSTSSSRSWHIYQGPEIAIDQNGVIYAVWSNWEECVEDPDMEYGLYSYNYDVFISKSLNEGITWSQPVKVNNDNTKTDQGFPSLKIDNNGDIYIAFLDRRNTPDVSEFDVYIAKSGDGGLTFSNIKVNDISVPNAYGGRDPGDYLDMLSVGETKVFVSHPCTNTDFSPPWDIPADVCVARLPKLGPISCTDTDGGKTYNTKGIVTKLDLSGTFTYTDTCKTSNNLKEYYCNTGKISSFVYSSCAYGCSDGKCNLAPNN